MAILRWLRWPAEAAKELVFAGATACFLFFDLREIQQEASQATIDWQYWALISFGSFCVVVLIDFGRLWSRVRQLESTQAVLEVTAHKEMIMGEFAGRPQEMDWHRIRVHNASKTAQAKDVVVKLHSIEPNPLELSPYPGRLGIKGGDPNIANPGDDILFDFVRDTKRGKLNLWTVEFQGQEFIPLDIDYIVTFSISAGNASLAFKKFKLRQPMRRGEKNALWLDGDVEFTPLGASDDTASSSTPSPESALGRAWRWLRSRL